MCVALAGRLCKSADGRTDIPEGMSPLRDDLVCYRPWLKYSGQQNNKNSFLALDIEGMHFRFVLVMVYACQEVSVERVFLERIFKKSLTL